LLLVLLLTKESNIKYKYFFFLTTSLKFRLTISLIPEKNKIKSKR